MLEKKIATNTIYQIITKLSTSASGFIITILIARYLGTQGYGQYTKITAFVSMFYLVADFGLNAIFLQLNQKESSIRRLLALRLTLSLLIVIFVNLLIFFLPFNPTQDIGFSPDLRFASFIFSLTIISQAIILSATAIFQKKLKYDLYMYSTIAGTLLTLGLIFLSSIIHAPLEYILLSYVLGGGLTALIALLLLREKSTRSVVLSGAKDLLKIDLKFSKQLLKASLPLGLMLFFNLVYFRIDIIILSLYKNTTDVALYGYAYKYFEFLLAIPLFLSNAVYPFLLRSLKNLRRNYQFSQKYLRLSLLLSLLILIPAWILAPTIAIVKNDFLPSVHILRILLLSLPIFFLTNLLQWILIAKNKKTYLLKIYLSCAITNTALNLIFIPSYGYTAAAIITCVSEMLILIMLLAKFISLKSEETND
jgi:O-antigen/teichoic acid export membrane protein